MTERFRPTVVRVDLDAIRHNVRTLHPAGAELMAIVKADGYGHGAVPVARAAVDAGASWLGVALVEEGLELRLAGLEVPILVLSELPRGSERVALAHRLTPVVYTPEGIAAVAAAAPGVGVHVKVDTGMHRVGIWPPEDAAGFCDAVARAGLQVEGVMTHLARSEDDEATTTGQLDRFRAAVEAVRAAGHAPRYVHAANSGAVIRHPESHLDLVRPGISLYGLEPEPGVGTELGLWPALRWTSAVATAQRLPAGARVSYGHRYELGEEAWVATVPVGYADGYPRPLSNLADVLIDGKRRRVIGSVTMDQLIVLCGQDDVAPGDEVVLIGRQGDEEVTVWELAGHLGTVAWEIVARIGPRVPREYGA